LTPLFAAIVTGSFDALPPQIKREKQENLIRKHQDPVNVTSAYQASIGKQSPE
jgi:hypothetical protein